MLIPYEKRKIPITTTVPLQMKEEIEKRNIKLQYVFIRGWQSINEETGQSETLKDMQEKIERMSKLINSQQTLINDTRNRQDQVKQ